MEYKLTQYSHGAGCGCKIAPAVLDQMLHTSIAQPQHPNLLVATPAATTRPCTTLAEAKR